MSQADSQSDVPVTECPGEQALVVFLTSPHENPILESHVDTCPTCQEAVERILRESKLNRWKTGAPTRSLTSPEADFDTNANSFSAAPAEFRRLGKFEIRERVGSGGFGIVYRAFDTVLRRDVALKIPKIMDVEDVAVSQRFEREAQLSAALQHSHIVTVLEAGVIDGRCYIASVFCSGSSLAQWLASEDRDRSPRTAAQIVLQLAGAVDHAHRAGILHRDIKPGNVLLDDSSPDAGLPFTPRLSDFGLAKVIRGAERETITGLVMGTPQYMAPEQADRRRGEISPRTDLYGLGAILYELLVGVAPAEGGDLTEVLHQLLFNEPVAVRKRNPSVSRDLEAICMKCLARNPLERYGSAKDLEKELRRFLEGQPITTRPIGLAHKVWLWCRRPERIREAGLFAIVLNVLLTVYGLVSIPIYLMLGIIEEHVVRPWEYVFSMAAAVGLLVVPIVYIAVRVMQGKRRWIITGFVVSIFEEFFFIAEFLGPLLNFGGIYDNEGARIATWLLIISLGLLQIAAFVVALVAHTALPPSLRK